MVSRSACLLLVAAACTACYTAPPTPATRAFDPPYAPGSLPALRDGTARSPRLANYRLDVALDPKTKQIKGSGTLTWTHAGTQPVNELPFHLYMNAFKNSETVFMKESRGKHRSATRSEDHWGWIDVDSLEVNGQELRAAGKYGEDETTLVVPLPAPIAPGATATIDFHFTTQLPEVFARTGYKGDFIMVGQWFPKIGVLVTNPDGGQRWACDTFHLASEFFADFGTYDVTLDVPADHVVAATGVFVGRDGQKRRYRAEDLHDFAFFADPHMQVSQATARTQTGKPVTLLLYHRPEQNAHAGRHLAAAQQALDFYSTRFYEYPWSVMTIIDPPNEAGGAGGMEYTTLVTTSGDLPLGGPGLPLGEFTTIHEVGHNWFQGILASNEVDEAWLDEGLNQYTNSLVLDAWRGHERSLIDLGGLHANAAEFFQNAGNPTDDVMPVATKSYAFADYGDYSESTYGKTADIMATLERMLGSERVLAALGAYAQRWAFKHPTREDFYTALSEAYGEDLRWFLVPARVDILLRFADGSQKRLRWDDGKTFARFSVPSAAELSEVLIDPDHTILLEHNRLDNHLRLHADSSASWRAATRVGFWTHTLLTLVGF